LALDDSGGVLGIHFVPKWTAGAAR
jgi:hypothetical protein